MHTKKATDKMCRKVFVCESHKSISHHLSLLIVAECHRELGFDLNMDSDLLYKNEWLWHLILINIFASKKFVFNNSLVLDIKLKFSNY